MGIPGYVPAVSERDPEKIARSVRNIYEFALALTNIRKNVTGNVTVAATDNGDTFDLSTSAGTVTYEAATKYTERHFNIISNDTSRRWSVVIDGTTFWVWPDQTALVFRVANEWRYHVDARWTPRTPPTFYVNHSTGNNSNDGLSTGSAFATIQKAFNVIEEFVDAGPASSGSTGPTINVQSTSFTENNVTHTKRLHGYHVIYLVGNQADPSTRVWTVGAGNTALIARDYSAIIVDGFEFQSSGGASTVFNVAQTGILDVWNIRFGAGFGIHLYSNNGGSIGYVVGADCTVLSDVTYHHYVSGSHLTCVAVDYVMSAVTFTIFAYILDNSAVLYNTVGFTGAGAGAGSTGQKYYVQYSASLVVTGVTLPGATAGAADAATFATAR